MERWDKVVLELELSQLNQHLKCRGEWVFVEKEKQQAKKDFEKLKELEKEGAKPHTNDYGPMDSQKGYDFHKTLPPPQKKE